MIPSKVNGNPVIWTYRLDPPRFPIEYAGDGPLEKTCAFLLSVADEGSEDERFWVSCLAESGCLTAGEMYYTLAEAKQFPTHAFGIANDGWKACV
jgi:hypothetical protein